ncbi:MAG: glycosyltransferase [Armatimonadia bacterium]|nr:glycosyltransferase [Armatimonadia bacterium]
MAHIADRVRAALKTDGKLTPGVPHGRALSDYLEVRAIAEELAHNPRNRAMANETDPISVIEGFRALTRRHDPDQKKGTPAHRCSRCGAWYVRRGRCCGAATAAKEAPYLTPLRSASTCRHPQWSIIVPVKNKVDLTKTALKSLARARGAEECEWVIVDCCSTDATHEFVADFGEGRQVTLLVCPPDEPFIYSRNLNRGARVAVGERYLFVNNDTKTQSKTVLVDLAQALDHPRVGVVGVAGLLAAESDLLPQDGYTQCRVPIAGHFWGMEASTYWALGGMDESLDGYGADEVDLELRVVRAHMHIAWVCANVEHRHSATFGEGTHATPLALRNGLIFEAKHGSPRDRAGEFYAFRNWEEPLISVVAVVPPSADTMEAERSLRRVFECANSSGRLLHLVVLTAAPPDRLDAALSCVAADFPDSTSYHRMSTQRPESEMWEWGLKRCMGQYIAPLRISDHWADERLNRLMDAMEGGAEAAGAGLEDPFMCIFRRGALATPTSCPELGDGQFVGVRPGLLEAAPSPRATEITVAPGALTKTPQANVSVIIPCFGRSDLLKDSLWSVLEQDLAPAEILLVDDGSDPPIEAPYQDSRIRILRQPRNQGPSAARNAGVRAAKGTYVKFLDSDDMLLGTDALRRFLSCAEEDGADLVYADNLMVNMVTGRIGRPFAGRLDETIYSANFLSPSQLLVKVAAFREVQFPESIRLSEDWTYLMRFMWRQQFTVSRIAEPLIIYRLNDESASNAWTGAFEYYSEVLDRMRHQALAVQQCGEAHHAHGSA